MVAGKGHRKDREKSHAKTQRRKGSDHAKVVVSTFQGLGMPRELQPSSVGELEDINDSVDAIFLFLKIFTEVAGELYTKAVVLA